MRASTVPTGTVCSVSTRISLTRPEAGAGTSLSILSVEMSQIVSSAFTQSPTRLCHATTVPSAIDTPIWGIVTATSVSVREELTARLLDVIDLRQDRAFERRRERNGDVRRCDAHDGAVEVLERALRDHGRDLRAGGARRI